MFDCLCARHWPQWWEVKALNFMIQRRVWNYGCPFWPGWSHRLEKTKSNEQNIWNNGFLDIGQQAVEGSDPSGKGNKQGEPYDAPSSLPGFQASAQQGEGNQIRPSSLPELTSQSWEFGRPSQLHRVPEYQREESCMEREELHREKFLEISWGFLFSLKLSAWIWKKCEETRPRKDHLKKQARQSLGLTQDWNTLCSHQPEENPRNTQGISLGTQESPALMVDLSAVLLPPDNAQKQASKGSNYF